MTQQHETRQQRRLQERTSSSNSKRRWSMKRWLLVVSTGATVVMALVALSTCFQRDGTRLIPLEFQVAEAAEITYVDPPDSGQFVGREGRRTIIVLVRPDFRGSICLAIVYRRADATLMVTRTAVHVYGAGRYTIVSEEPLSFVPDIGGCPAS